MALTKRLELLESKIDRYLQSQQEVASNAAQEYFSRMDSKLLNSVRMLQGLVGFITLITLITENLEFIEKIY